MAEVKITKENFVNEVINSDIPVLLDFWATWCGPCRMLASVIEEIAEEYDGKIKIGKVNVDEEDELAFQFDISSIPTVIAFNKGEALETQIGYCSKETLLGMII